jgi:hypothetical protein
VSYPTGPPAANATPMPRLMLATAAMIIVFI